MIAGACTLPPSSEQDPASIAEPLEGRPAYREVSLPPKNQRFGADPEEISLDAFGIAEPVEGNFTQEVDMVKQTRTRAIVSLIQTGLPDDSVKAIRYRLEFESEENQWELVWAGRQVRCWPGRGSQEWSRDLCK